MTRPNESRYGLICSTAGDAVTVRDETVTAARQKHGRCWLHTLVVCWSEGIEPLGMISRCFFDGRVGAKVGLEILDVVRSDRLLGGRRVRGWL